MKKIYISSLLAAVLLLAVQAHLSGAPIANSNYGRDYLIGSSSLEKWSTGVAIGIGERRLTRNSTDFDMDFAGGLAYVGYDIHRWVTAYAAIGVKDVKFNNINTDNSQAETGVGLHFNILDQEIMDPTLIEDRIRINANVYLGLNEADWEGRTYEWQEISANLTISIVNDMDGNIGYTPESIAIFVGPAYSDNESDDFDTDETLGFIAGLEVFLTKRISFDLAMTKFDRETFTGSMNIRF